MEIFWLRQKSHFMVSRTDETRYYVAVVGVKQNIPAKTKTSSFDDRVDLDTEGELCED